MSGPRVVLPYVLPRLDWGHRLGKADYREVSVPAVELLSEYFTEMNLGVAYERFVQGPENRSRPHELTEGNWRAAFLVHARGMSRATMADLLGRTLPELESVPPDADLFETREFDDPVVALVRRLTARRGVAVANATKLLYQKRPRLVPVVDGLFRHAFGVHWLEGDWGDVMRLALERLRAVAARPGNAEPLAAVDRWMRSPAAVTSGLVLSRVRVLDVLGWMTTLRRERHL
jgi:hypothetical protein